MRGYKKGNEKKKHWSNEWIEGRKNEEEEAEAEEEEEEERRKMKEWWRKRKRERMRRICDWKRRPRAEEVDSKLMVLAWSKQSWRHRRPLRRCNSIERNRMDRRKYRKQTRTHQTTVTWTAAQRHFYLTLPFFYDFFSCLCLWICPIAIVATAVGRATLMTVLHWHNTRYWNRSIELARLFSKM